MWMKILVALTVLAFATGGAALVLMAKSRSTSDLPTSAGASGLRGEELRVTQPPDAALSDAARDLQGWVFIASNGAMFVQWIETGNTLSGSLQTTWQNSKAANGVSTESLSFFGTRSGSQLALNFPQGLGTSTKIAGVLKDSMLTLFVPDPERGTIQPYGFRQGSVAEYNSAVAALQQRVNRELAATQVARAEATRIAEQRQATQTRVAVEQQAVRDANDALRRGLQRLNEDTSNLARATSFDEVLKAYARDFSSMQADYRQAQTEATKQPLDCYQRSQVGYAASQVAYGLSQIRYDDSQLQYLQRAIERDIATIQADIAGDRLFFGKSVQVAWAELKAAVASNSTGTPLPAYKQEDVDAAITAAQKQIDASTSALQDAQIKAAEFGRQAEQLSQTAKDFADGLQCSH